MAITQEALTAFIQEYRESVDSYILGHPFLRRVKPEVIRVGAVSYLERGGKRLRPFLAKACCEAVGGNPEEALPAAAAVEVYHMWTLVHDDIIDRDELRRGQPTLHRHYSLQLDDETEMSGDVADHYGTSLSLLTGDVQHGLAITLLSDLYRTHEPLVVIALIREMCGPLLADIMGGEVMDVQLALMNRRRPTVEQIIEMMIGKTASLLEFSALAGATVGLGRFAPEEGLVRQLTTFAKDCGIAFQLQDDLLGIIGDEKTLGKPIGADLREGKYTTIIHFALEVAQGQVRSRLLESLGEQDLSDQDIAELRKILEDLGALERTRTLAEEYLDQGLKALASVPESPARDELRAWADFLVKRTL